MKIYYSGGQGSPRIERKKYWSVMAHGFTSHNRMTLYEGAATDYFEQNRRFWPPFDFYSQFDDILFAAKCTSISSHFLYKNYAFWKQFFLWINLVKNFCIKLIWELLLFTTFFHHSILRKNVTMLSLGVVLKK